MYKLKPHLKLFISLLFCFFFANVNAQDIRYVQTRFSSDFSEWVFLDIDENRLGSTRKRFQHLRQENQWNIEMGEVFYEAEMTWPDKGDEWQFRGGDESVTARVLWHDDFTQWRISNDDISITFKGGVEYGLNVWYDPNEDFGAFEIYTSFNDDFREWVVDDLTDEEVTPLMKQAMIFIATFYTVRLR